MTEASVSPLSYTPQDRLYVWALVNPAAPVLLGELALSQLVADCATFTYDAAWWQFPLSEDLPLRVGQAFSAGERNSAPGAIDDARPDRWGERIIRHIDRPRRLSILEMLLFAGDDRFGALGVSVSAQHYVPRRLGPYPTLRDLAPLSRAVEDVQTQAPLSPEIQRLVQPAVSLGGARPKALLQTDAGACVIKFSEVDDVVDTPLIEHATMRLATLAGITTAATAALPLAVRHGRQRHALTIVRFDRMGDLRVHCLSARTALRAAGLSESYGVGVGAAASGPPRPAGGDARGAVQAHGLQYPDGQHRRPRAQSQHLSEPGWLLRPHAGLRRGAHAAEHGLLGARGGPHGCRVQPGECAE